MGRPGARVEIEGLGEVRSALRKAKHDLDDLKGAGKDAADMVAGEARTIVPRLTGTLEQTIRGAGQAGGAVVRAGNAKVVYAPIIHFGWPAHGIEPRPFIYDALDRRADEVVTRYRQALDRIADEFNSGGMT